MQLNQTAAANQFLRGEIDFKFNPPVKSESKIACLWFRSVDRGREISAYLADKNRMETNKKIKTITVDLSFIACVQSLSHHMLQLLLVFLMMLS